MTIFKKTDRIILAGAFSFIVVVSCLCFLPDLRNDLLQWDDFGYIVENYHIQNLSADTIRWAFSEFYLNYWAPLTWLSLALDYFFWGLNPIGYHLTNNIIHALNAGLFFLISFQLINRISPTAPDKQSGDLKSHYSAIFYSLLAATLFAIHPLRVESVAWATERKDVLSMFFGLASVLAYLSHTNAINLRSSGSKASFVMSRYYGLTVILYCMSLMSKTMFVTLPVVLLVLDWFPLKRINRQNFITVIAEKVPFMILAGITSAIAMRSQAAVMFSFDQIDINSRLLNAFKSVVAYLWLTIWPFRLSPFYVHPVKIQGIPLEYGLQILIFAVISFFCILTVKRRPVFMSVWMIYLITLFPFLGITQIGPQAMAGRFTYLSGLPISLLFAVGIRAAFLRFSTSKPRALLLAAALAMVLVTSGYLTVREISFWKNDETLWGRVIELAPHSVGRAYFQRSHAYVAKGKLREALDDINEALAIAERKKYRSLDEIYSARARILARLGDLEGAIADYTTALQTANEEKGLVIRMERGALYNSLGKIDLANRDFGHTNADTDRSAVVQ